MRVATLCLAALVVLAGCSGAVTTSPSDAADATDSPDPTATPTPSPTPDETATEDPSAGSGYPDDPAEDVVGWEKGYWHNESIAVDNGDGLNDSEFEMVLARTMARVEVIREKEFQKDLTVEFITRQELQDRGLFSFRENEWRDQYWEAAFVVGEDTSTAEAFTDLYSVVVDGYYGSGTIVTVQENPDQPRIDPTVLAHEVGHALSGVDRVEGPTRPLTADERLALRSEEEGQASWVDTQYEQRCGEQWECIERPESAEETPDRSVNMGLYLQFAAPYTLGQGLIEHEYERKGVEGVNDVQRYPPTSMEQVVHPETYREDEPVDVTIADRSANDWTQLRRTGGRFGEVVLYTMLWKNGVIETKDVDVRVDQQTGLNYSHPATEGWGGDAVIAYENDGSYGYVFKSVWDSEQDAAEFQAAYLELLEKRGAEQVDDHTYVIESGPYADAFRVVRQGDTLVVVNAPTVDALDEVHPTNASA